MVGRNLTKKERACACAVFLRKCLESNVIPKSLIIKPPQLGETVNPQTAYKYKTCAKQASINNLKIALKDANERAHEQRSQFSEFFSGILNGLEAPEKNFIIKYITKMFPFNVISTIISNFTIIKK